MAKPNVPPSIEFEEEEPHRTAPLFSSPLTRFVRLSSFGLIKNDTQAALVIILVLSALGVAVYHFAEYQAPVPPTVYYELLPQESVGSTQGIPPSSSPSYE